MDMQDFLDFIYSTKSISRSTLLKVLEDEDEDEDDVLDLLGEAEYEGWIKNTALIGKTYEITRAGEEELSRLQEVEDEEEDEDEDEDDYDVEIPRLFLVHGHDLETLRTVQVFLLQEFEGQLRVVVLMDQPNQGSETLSSKLLRHTSACDLAVILYTPDDEAHSKRDPSRVEGRARPNVNIEFGIFLGQFGPKRTWLLHKRGATLPSDVAGCLRISLDGDWRWELSRDLRHFLEENED